MLNNIRNFSKTWFAKILLVIIIIPFVFWGMGGVFSSGNTNTIAKINNSNISTKDFVEFINNTRLNPEYIQKNIDNNILEELLSELISSRLVDLELKEFNITLSEKSLAEKIKNNENFLDEKRNFSRIMYEKFLLENNLSAIEFEEKLKKNELKKNLFTYISGGIKAPYFITNQTFKDQNKLITLSYINLDKLYKKEEEFSILEVENFINENKEILEKELIDFTYVKITPENLVQEKDYSENFFLKIDELENQLFNGTNIRQISKNFGLKLNTKDNYIDEIKDEDSIFNEIYKKRNEKKIQIIEKNNFFLLYEIDEIKRILPNKNDIEFIKVVKNKLFKSKKLEYNKNLLVKIENKNFTNNDFSTLGNNGQYIKTAYLESINDLTLFTTDSMKLIYSLPKKSFLLITDKNKNIFLAKLDEYYSKDIIKNSKDFLNYKNKTNIIIKDNLYTSYNYLMNSKYKITINEKTLDRVKNYFQ